MFKTADLYVKIHLFWMDVGKPACVCVCVCVFVCEYTPCQKIQVTWVSSVGVFRILGSYYHEQTHSPLLGTPGNLHTCTHTHLCVRPSMAVAHTCKPDPSWVAGGGTLFWQMKTRV